jgi:hypothetical protein
MLDTKVFLKNVLEPIGIHSLNMVTCDFFLCGNFFFFPKQTFVQFALGLFCHHNVKIHPKNNITH